MAVAAKKLRLDGYEDDFSVSAMAFASSGVKLKTQKPSDIWVASFSGEVDRVRAVVERKPSLLNAKDKDGFFYTAASDRYSWVENSHSGCWTDMGSLSLPSARCAGPGCAKGA
jgi:hypothetical protein